MSGGAFNYFYEKFDDLFDYMAEIGQLSKEEKEIVALLKDLQGLLCAWEWYRSGDYSKEHFMNFFNDFKKKWLKEVVK
jgi:hypothetical protein